MIEPGENHNLVVGIGDIKIGKAPSVIVTSLGSCVGVCLYAPQEQVGGMIHFMMASSKDVNKNSPTFREEKYGDIGIPLLITQLKESCGISATSLKAKIFGGGGGAQKFYV